jgi:hypothetical protein
MEEMEEMESLEDFSVRHLPDDRRRGSARASDILSRTA